MNFLFFLLARATFFITSPTISEANWHLCKLVFKFLNSNNKNKNEILVKFLSKERLYRKKLSRYGYINKTVKNVIKMTQNTYSKVLDDNNTKSTNINTNNVLKTCNTMFFSYLVQTGKNALKTKVISNKSDNYLELTVPYSISPNDLVYYI